MYRYFSKFCALFLSKFKSFILWIFNFIKIILSLKNLRTTALESIRRNTIALTLVFSSTRSHCEIAVLI